MQPMHELPFYECLYSLHASITLAAHVHHHPLPTLSECICTCHNYPLCSWRIHRALHTSTLTPALLPIIHQSSCRNATEKKEKNALLSRSPRLFHCCSFHQRETFLCLRSSAGSIGIMLATTLRSLPFLSSATSKNPVDVLHPIQELSSFKVSGITSYLYILLMSKNYYK